MNHAQNIKLDRLSPTSLIVRDVSKCADSIVLVMHHVNDQRKWGVTIKRTSTKSAIITAPQPVISQLFKNVPAWLKTL